MGRSRNPEQTYEKILETSARLFIEQGYEQTSIQDIQDALHLSRGGLYHHFKSKEEILEAVMQKRSQYIANMLHDVIQNTKAENAKERLKKILYQIGIDSEAHALDHVLTTQVKQPYFVVSGLQTCINQDAPILCGLIEEGIMDGSLHTAMPAYCAEVFLLLLNFWANPALFGRSFAETKERLQFLQSIMYSLGLDVIDDDLIALLLSSFEKMGAFVPV